VKRARFTALGEDSRQGQPLLLFPSRRNAELPGMIGLPMMIGQPHKAAMARRSPKELSDCGEARFTALGASAVTDQPPLHSRNRMNPDSRARMAFQRGLSQPHKAAMARRSPKRARFTALGEDSRQGQPLLLFPSHRNAELPGMIGLPMMICQPHKAAMARRSPKRARFTALGEDSRQGQPLLPGAGGMKSFLLSAFELSGG